MPPLPALLRAISAMEAEGSTPARLLLLGSGRALLLPETMPLAVRLYGIPVETARNAIVLHPPETAPADPWPLFPFTLLPADRPVAVPTEG